MKQRVLILLLIASSLLNASYPPEPSPAFSYSTDEDPSLALSTALYIIPQLTWGVCGLIGFSNALIGIRRIYHQHQVQRPDILERESLWDNNYQLNNRHARINPYVQTALGIGAVYGTYMLCMLD